MKAKIILFTVALLILGSKTSSCQTQDLAVDNQVSEEINSSSKQAFKHKIALKIDYFGELVLHPGLSVGMEYSLVKKKWITLHWDSELGAYWHRWNHSAVFLRSSIGTRFPIKSLFVDLNVGAGYMHSFAAGTVYQKAPEGGIEKAKNLGHPHFMPFSSLLIGWDGTRKSKLPMTFHVGLEVYLQSSFNHIFLPHAAAKLGFTYKFKNHN